MNYLPLITDEYLITFFLSLCVLLPAVLQMSPLVEYFTDKERLHLGAGILAIFIAEYVIMHGLFLSKLLAFNVRVYNELILVLWIPYFLLSLYFYRKHIFWCTISSITIAMIGIVFYTLTTSLVLHIIPAGTYDLYYPYDMLAWLMLFLLFSPALIRFLHNQFAMERLKAGLKLWRNMLPIMVFMLAESISINEFIYDLYLHNELVIPRLTLLAAMFFFGHSMLESLRQYNSIDIMETEKQEMQTQIASLDDYINLAEKSKSLLQSFMKQRQAYLTKLQHAVNSHDRAAATHIIEEMGTTINSTKMPQYCSNAICNAAIATYAARAKEEQIDFLSSVDLPAEIGMESEFSVVLANLLENAIKASQKQPPEKRKISLVAMRQGDTGWVNLLLRNKYDGEVLFDMDGYPRSTQSGHGLGTTSLRQFVEKNHGNVLLEHEDNWFSVYLHLYCGELPQT